MRLDEINDDHLRAHLAGRISLDELAAGMSGIEPYEIRDGVLVALTREEIEAKNEARREATMLHAMVRAGKIERCRYARFSTDPAAGCASCKGVRVECSHPSRHGLACNSKRCTRDACKFFEAAPSTASTPSVPSLPSVPSVPSVPSLPSRPSRPSAQSAPRVSGWKRPRISAILPARDEGDEVARTIESFRAAGVNEFVVLDDASRHDSCRGLDARDTTVIRHEEPLGPAACRNEGARIASGDILIFADAHERAENLRRLAAAAWELPAIVCAAVRSLDAPEKNWTGYGGKLTTTEKGDYKVAYHTHPHPQRLAPISALIGACYAVSRRTFEALGGWPPTRAWGYNEQALSMAAHFAGVLLLADNETVVQHRFKRAFNYPVASSATHLNRYIVHWLLCQDTWDVHWREVLTRAYPRGLAEATALFETAEMQEARDRYRQVRRRGDGEVCAYVASLDAPRGRGTE
jgi:GT2 family glycosyltransferase